MDLLEINREYARVHRLAFPEYYAEGYRTNREARIAAVRKYQATERGRAVDRACRVRYRASEKGKAAKRAAAARYRLLPATREKKRVEAFRRYWRNPEHSKEIQLKYRRTPKGKAIHAAHERARRLKKRGLVVEPGARSVIVEIKTAPSLLCTWCFTPVPIKKRHIEHIVATQNGGRHSADNLTCSCAKCNCRKKALPLDQWIERIAA